MYSASISSYHAERQQGSKVKNQKACTHRLLYKYDFNSNVISLSEYLPELTTK